MHRVAVAATYESIGQPTPVGCTMHSASLQGIIMSIYTNEGFANRREYLEDLADQTGVDLETVLILADLFGPNEDFDGLVTALEDHAQGY